MNFKKQIIALCCLAAPLVAQANIDPEVLKEVQALIASSETIIENARKAGEDVSSNEAESFSKISLIKKEQCQSGPCAGLESKASGLTVFISSSVSLSSWKEHSYYLERLGGRFVLRGLPNNSFMGFLQFLKECKQNQIFAPVDLDPDLYQKYHIEEVPTIVLDDGEKFDKIVGNITIKQALNLFAEKGEASSLAKKLSFNYQQVKASEVLREK